MANLLDKMNEASSDGFINMLEGTTKGRTVKYPVKKGDKGLANPTTAAEFVWLKVVKGNCGFKLLCGISHCAGRCATCRIRNLFAALNNCQNVRQVIANGRIGCALGWGLRWVAKINVQQGAIIL